MRKTGVESTQRKEQYSRTSNSWGCYIPRLKGCGKEEEPGEEDPPSEMLRSKQVS